MLSVDLPWNHAPMEDSEKWRTRRRTIEVSAGEVIRMLPKGQVNSPRKLVWIEGQGFSGWGCSECIWVFNNPSGWPPGNSLDEIKRILQAQLDKEFECHICKKAASARGSPP
jgi:hypothetical protein